MKRHTSQSGYTLIETVVYVTITALLLGVLILSVVTLVRAYSRVVAAKNVDESASILLDRFSREVRNSYSVTSISINPVSVTLGGRDEEGNFELVRFLASSSRVYIDINGNDPAPLTLRDATVSNLTFTQVASSSVSAVRISFDVESSKFGFTENAHFESAAVLREKQ